MIATKLDYVLITLVWRYITHIKKIYKIFMVKKMTEYIEKYVLFLDKKIEWERQLFSV